MIALYPKKEQLEALLRSPQSGPVVMLNLLRFKERATAPDEGASGQEAYQRYGDAMRTIVESRGGRFLWLGSVDSPVIGSEAEGFQMAALVEVSVALALSLPNGPYRELILTMTYVVVVFSILVQGLTIGPVLRRVVGNEQRNSD